MARISIRGYLAVMKEQWKYFERVVAAIHIAETAGAKVTWNEDIQGKQFDVTIRFKTGLYDYLTLIECKDYQRPVPVEKVEAFVTKSQRAGANKAIMVSSSGFQSGAKEVAEDCKIELYTLTITEDLPEEMWSDDTVDMLNVYNVKFKKTGSKKVITLPEEYNMLPFLMRHTVIKKINEEISPEEIVDKLRPQLTDIVGIEPKVFKVSFPSGTKVDFPYSKSPLAISEMSFDYRLANARLVKGKEVLFDPVLQLRPQYEYENVLTGEKHNFTSNNVYPGFDTKFEVGKFYRNMNMFMAYYCESIHFEVENGEEKELATLLLIESYQMASLFQATIVQETQYAFYNVEITDKKEIARLKRMLQGYKGKHK